MNLQSLPNFTPHSQADENRLKLPKHFLVEMLLILLIVAAGFFLIWGLLIPGTSLLVIFAAGVAFTLGIVFLIRLLMDPESVRARQTNGVLLLASKMLRAMSDDGLNKASAQKICELLLPATAAIAVAITDQELILGYAGFSASENPAGAAIRTQATYATLEDGKKRILFNPKDIGFPNKNTRIHAAIIVPIMLGKTVSGTLKFYFRHAKQISETQKSLASGFGEVISTQFAAFKAEEASAMATKMELKMLQSQINPHFLFNTINTIASLTRTDPAYARNLLREFAKFYRATLENSKDMITLSSEVEQTQRYFDLELARFGKDRLNLVVDVNQEVESVLVPPFILQPLVENCVRHAMPSEGLLTITIHAAKEGENVAVSVTDDGNGMTDEQRENMLHPRETNGLGIAVSNVHDRICGCYAQGSGMKVRSVLGEGTTVTLLLVAALTGNTQG